MISITSLSLSSIPTFLLHRPSTHIPKCTLTTTNTNTNPTTETIVIGGGLAGLSAATHLHSAKIPFILLESSDDVGGRVRTDTLDGFLLDRGFQIFITSYPECRKLLDYSSLNLKKFFSGARIYYNNQFYTVADPFRHLIPSLTSLTNPIGSVFDKLRIFLTTVRVLSKSNDDIFRDDEVTVFEYLRSSGFSVEIIDRFFRPFFGGIFFDTELETTSRLFEFVFRCLALGDNTLPEKGIGEIPRQLADKLPGNSVRLNTKVVSVEENGGGAVVVRLENGEELVSEAGVILAVEEPEVKRLLARVLTENVEKDNKPCRSTVCLYFSTDRDKVPTVDPILYLNGSGRGIVNNMFFATNVAKSYGSLNKALVSVTLIGLYDDVSDQELISRVLQELSSWFGESVVREWKYLRTYRIRFAQPNQSPPTNLMKSPRVGSRLYLCGDYQTSATFDGALASGRRVVEALLEDKALNRFSVKA
ncbi:15-cis-phytoene desaturase, chloroplastic/chromoplastic [Silene latifolia]|uniref:15-cis-phytoene desaturase, chloroplastic/chromoplastic n=1 Tax=Silene latifolia TaxID=37657 RepID=UPI003D77701C